MDRETILQKSRESSAEEGFERHAEKIAARISRSVAGILCCIVMLLGGFVFLVPEMSLGVAVVSTGMDLSYCITKYILQKTRRYLFLGIAEGVVLIASAVVLFLILFGVV